MAIYDSTPLSGTTDSGAKGSSITLGQAQESCPRCGSPDRRIRFATDEERVEVSGGESYTPSTFLDYVRALYDPLTVLAERYIPRLDGTHFWRGYVLGECQDIWHLGPKRQIPRKARRI